MRGRFLLVLVLAALGGADAARGGPGWESDPRYGELRDQEVKELGALLEKARKDEFHAQAWWLADRMLALDPENERALSVAEGLFPDDLDRAAVPNDRFTKARDKAFEDLGDAYFRFGEQLEAAGVDPTDYFPVTLQAHRYGSRAGTLLTALENAGCVWLGTFDEESRTRVDELLGRHAARATWPPSWDDAYVRVRSRWPEGKVADLGDLRLVTDVGREPALRLLRTLAEIDAWLATWEGGRAASKKARGPATAGTRYEFLVFLDQARFAKIAPEFVDEREREDLLKTSAFRARTRARTLVSFEHRQHPFVAGEATWAGAAAATLARRRWGAGQGGSVRGRGAWLLEGLAAAFEGFHLDEDGQPQIDPGRCWSLAVAARLREEGRLLPWEDLLELDEAGAAAVPRVDVEADIAGTQRVLKDVDVVRVQSAALVIGMVKGDGERGARRFAKLVTDLIKRDSLPDLDKAMSWKKGRHVDEADRAMDAANAR